MQSQGEKHICIASESYIIRQGLQSILRQSIAVDLRILYALAFDDVLAYLRNYEVDLLLISNKLLHDSQIAWTKFRFEFSHLKVVVLIEDRALAEKMRYPYARTIDLYTGDAEILSLLNELYPTMRIGEVDKEQAKLTEREREVLRLMVKGLTTAQIAEALFLSPYTVSTHRKNILNKLKIKTMAGLTVYAVMQGILSIHEVGEALEKGKKH